jgi:hypothetical protein
MGFFLFFDKYSPKRAAIDDALVLLEYELFVVYKPGLVVFHLKKEGI